MSSKLLLWAGVAAVFALLAGCQSAGSSPAQQPAQPDPAQPIDPSDNPNRPANPGTENGDDPAPPPARPSLYDFTVNSLEGQPVNLSQYRGKVVLIVNVASRCGYTPQYAGLQKLHDEFSAQGFAVLGFPSNEFGGQEPGSAADIRQFCTEKFDVTFPMFEKIRTRRGEGQSAVYAFLTEGRDAPNWNFCKYLVGKDGQVIAFFNSRVTPESAQLRDAINAALADW